MRGWHTAVLTKEDVVQILQGLHDGERVMDLAAEFGVSRQQITRIKTGKRWSSLTGLGTDERKTA
jgi:hypothetical protein